MTATHDHADHSNAAWQPIRTAPLDRPVRVRDLTGREATVFWYDLRRTGADKPGAWAVAVPWPEGSFPALPWQPTHWHLLDRVEEQRLASRIYRQPPTAS